MKQKTEIRIMQLLLAVYLIGMPNIYGWKVNVWRAEATNDFERHNAEFGAVVFSVFWPITLPFSLAGSAYASKQPVQLERTK